MNLDKALDKAYERCDFPAIADLPPSSLQGLADRVDEPLKQIGITTVAELGSWIFYKRAKSIVTLSATETSNGRLSDSAMNLEGIVPKKYAKKLLAELADMPVSTLQGISAKQAQILETVLQVKTVRDLANNKFVGWAESMATLSDVRTGKEPTTPGPAVALGEPRTPYRTPAGRQVSTVVATPVSTHQAMTLQLEDYKLSMGSLNDRLKHYIDLIRERDETITELNAEKHMLKNQHVREVKDMDSSYLFQMKDLQSKVDKLHQKDILQLESQVRDWKNQKEKEAKKYSDMEGGYRTMQAEYESMKMALTQAYNECVDSKKAADESKALADSLDAKVARLVKESTVLEKDVTFVKSQAEVHVKALANADNAKKLALDELNKSHLSQHKKQREELLLQSGQERDALKKTILAQTTQERLTLVEKHNELKEMLETELRKSTIMLVDAEQKLETASRELEQIRALYSELKIRYERECTTQKVRIAELTSDYKNANSSNVELQSDFNKFVGESRTIVKEIDRYNALMTAEESRLGLATPGSISAKAKKRRRTEEDDEEAPDTGAPPQDTGLLGSIKRVLGGN